MQKEAVRAVEMVFMVLHSWLMVSTVVENSTRQISNVTGGTLVKRLLKTSKYHSYHIALHQKLNARTVFVNGC